jgi:hypothetical protein
VNAGAASVNSFIHFSLDLQQKQVHHWKEHETWVEKQLKHFAFSLYFYAISALEEDVNTYKPVCI